MRKSKEDLLFPIFNYFLLTLISLITIFPLYYVFVVSFTDPSEYVKGGMQFS